MARAFLPKVATTNDLFEGDAIWFTAQGTWTRHLSEAQTAATPEQAEALLAAASAYPGQTVGVYLADVTLIDGTPTPAHFREDFRTRGPSNYFHGKQADTPHSESRDV